MTEQRKYEIAIAVMRSKGKRTSYNFDVILDHAQEIAQALDVTQEELREFVVALRAKKSRMKVERIGEIAYSYFKHLMEHENVTFSPKRFNEQAVKYSKELDIHEADLRNFIGTVLIEIVQDRILTEQLF